CSAAMTRASPMVGRTASRATRRRRPRRLANVTRVIGDPSDRSTFQKPLWLPMPGRSCERPFRRRGAALPVPFFDLSPEVAAYQEQTEGVAVVASIMASATCGHAAWWQSLRTPLPSGAAVFVPHRED